MIPTLEQIELMVKVFDDLINNIDPYFDPTNIIHISEKYHISKDLAQFILNEIYQIGHNEKFLVANKSSFGDYELVQPPNQILCKNFKYHGGFKKYFSNMDKDLKFEQNIHVDNIIDQSIKVDNQSSLSMADNKPNIKNSNNDIKNANRKMSKLEITSWISGIIAAIIGLIMLIIEFKKH